MLEIRDLSVSYGELKVLDKVSFTAQKNRWLMIAGPNGAGKSTVVSAVSGKAPYSGAVLLDGRDIKSIKPMEKARLLGVLEQSHYLSYAFSVEEIVRLGRYSRMGAFSNGSDEDSAAVERALEITGMEQLRRQSALTLSGGELQRAFLAQAFAQEPRVLILDEPTNHLDLPYQQQVFDIIGEWVKTGERAVVAVVHDITLARAFGDDAVLLNRGTLAAAGGANETLTDENLSRVYGMDVRGWLEKLYAPWRRND